MKTNRLKINHSTRLIAVAFGLAALCTVGCAQKDSTADATTPSVQNNSATPAAAPSSQDAAAATATTPSPQDMAPATPSSQDATANAATSSTSDAAVAGSDATTSQWRAIKDDTFDMRAQYLAGLQGIEAKMDDQIAALTASNTATNGSASSNSTTAMKKLTDAQTNLKSLNDEVNNATVDNWSQEKDKVAQALRQTRDAYRNVQSSPAN